MAQQKMHCAFRRTCQDIQKDAYRNNLSSGESLGDNDFCGNTKDCEVSSIVWRNYSHRSTVLAFLTPEPNGYRFIIMPWQCHDHRISRRSPQTNMDDLNMITLSPFGSLKVGAQKIHIGPITDKDWYIAPPIARSILRPQFLHWSCVKGFVNDESNWQVFAFSSFCKNPFISVEYPLVLSNGSDAANSAHRYVNFFKEKGAERKLRRKSTKRREKNNDLSISIGLSELNSRNESSKSQADCIRDIDLGVNLPPHAGRSAVSLPDHMGKGTNQDIIINDSAMPKTITSCSFTIDTSDAGLPYLPEDFSSENHLSDSENGCQMSSTEALILNQETQNGCRKLIRYSDLYYTGVNDSLVLDSVSLGTTNDETCTAEPDLKLSNEEDAGVGLLKSPHYSVKKEVACSEDMLSGVVEPCKHARRRHRARKGTDRDRNSHALGKREKRFRKVPQDSSVHKVISLGNLKGHSGKENTRSIWQKVQRNDADECNYKDNVVISQYNNGYKQAPVHCKHQSVSSSCMLSKPGDSNLTMLKVSRKVKRKKGPGSKQEFNCYCRKESHAIKVCSYVGSKIDMQQNGISGAHASRQNELSNDSSSVSSMSSRIGFQTKKVESISYQPVQKSEASSSNSEAYESTHASVPVLSVQIAENHSNLSSPPCRFPDLSEVHKAEVHKEFAFFNDDKAKMEKEMPPTDHSNQNAVFEAVSEKWLPVRGNNSGMPDMGQSTFSVEELKVAEESLSMENIGGQQSASDPCFLAYSTEVNHSNLDSKYANAIMSDNETQVQRFTKNSTFTSKDCCSLTAKKCRICQFKKQTVFGPESDSGNIFQAVNDAYKAQLASEAIERVTGCPIAEFEKFMHSASPVICKSQVINSCQAWSPGQTGGASPCEHETPNLPLGSLWQWYEKHGVCGLEVRSEDYENSNRLGVDQFAFRAYYVPYLSAVQLFRECRSHSTDNRAVGAHENKSSESSSGVGLLSVFPMLVPQPRAENSSILSQLNLASNGESSLVCMNENVQNQSADSKFSDDIELLFEYFESEQPQQRRPLFEMIKELASGEKPPKCRLYGDPTILESVGLHDLHPNSWFSVAWYPVYRIPDGKLRAAFLTYHSLGHFVRRGPTRGSHCVDASVVSPAVGLQCYNAQGECWFRPRHPTECKEDRVLDADPSQILKERIRSLEETASLMARAVVRRGGQTYSNKQPDYEFFLSRRR